MATSNCATLNQSSKTELADNTSFQLAAFSLCSLSISCSAYEREKAMHYKNQGPHNYTVGLPFTENSISKTVTLTENLLFTFTDSAYRRSRTQQFLSTADSQFPPNTHEVIRRGNITCGGQRRFEQMNSRSVKVLWLQRPQKTAVLGATQWWELGVSVSHSRSVLWPLITHPAAPPATNCWGAEGVPSVWPLSRATTSSFGHITAPTLTFVIIHGYLCITGRTGAAVLCTCNSTSSQSPEEGSGQEGVCQQAGHTGHMQANRGTSEIDQFTVSLCFFFASPIEFIF